MSKINCWEHKRCGREQGGNKTEELGICPAAVNTIEETIDYRTTKEILTKFDALV